jgi:hypothetical protein
VRGGETRPANVELILDWIAALRSGETEAIAELLDPDVVWHGVTGDLSCVGRADVIDALQEQLPMSLDLDALEVISAPGHVVVGTRSEHLPEPPGVTLDGQIYNVFERRGRRFVSIRDFALRTEALSSVGLDGAFRWR